MDIVTILTSYNRPKLIKQAIESVLEQQADKWNRNHLVIVDDHSEKRNEIEECLFSIDVPETVRLDYIPIEGRVPTIEERYKTNRLGPVLNVGLDHVLNDCRWNANKTIVTYLVDDDYFLPGWFKALREAYKQHGDWDIIYGKEYVSGNMEKRLTADECWEENKTVRWFDKIDDPFDKLDHNQVSHMLSVLLKFKSPIQPIVPIDNGCRSGVDAYFFRKLRGVAEFHGIDVPACVKRFHSENYQALYSKY